jgi:hypothetical protein
MTDVGTAFVPATPVRTVSRLATVTILGAGILAAIALPEHRPGLGVSLVALTIAAGVILGRSFPMTWDRVSYAVLAVILASMASVRAAEWVVAVDLLAALGLGCLAVVGLERWRDLIRAPLAVASRANLVGRFLKRGLGWNPPGTRRWAPVLRSGILGAFLVIVFGGLFLSADAAFAELASRWLLPDWDLGLLPARVVVFGLVVILASSLAAAGSRLAWLGAPLFQQGQASPREGPRRRLGPGEWALAVGLLDLLFLAFVLVQVTVLFGGRSHVLDTAGLTYAEYARQGFFQLVVVAALTLGVIAGTAWWARRDRAGDTRLLRLLLGLLCLLTLVVLASALRRLTLYEDVFGLTHLRVTVHAAILWMAGLFGLVLVAGVRMRGRWLPRAAVLLTAGAVVTFTLLNPDGLIATRNVDRYEETGRIDLDYLRSLSPDAVPALSRLPDDIRSCALAPHRDLLTEPDTLMGWNLARRRAVSELQRIGESSCPMSAGSPLL